MGIAITAMVAASRWALVKSIVHYESQWLPHQMSNIMLDVDYR